jgi:hypothetical protein
MAMAALEQYRLAHQTTLPGLGTTFEQWFLALLCSVPAPRVTDNIAWASGKGCGCSNTYALGILLQLVWAFRRHQRAWTV